MIKKYLLLTNIILFIFLNNSYSETNSIEVDQIFHIGKMDSHNKEFVLFFKTREKAILAKGEEFNYITDYPQDLYIFDKITKKSKSYLNDSSRITFSI